jgi:hypothetical protein
LYVGEDTKAKKVNVTALPLDYQESRLVPTAEGAGWVPEPMGSFWIRENLLPLPRFEARTVQPVA